MSLLNKVAIVTGGSSGIGAAIAIKFVEEGARVVIVGRNEAKLKRVSEICEKKGTKPLTIVADVSIDKDIEKVIAESLNCFGKLDILINNAGIGGSSSILNGNAIKDFDRIMNTNLRAVVYMTHLAAKHLIETKGNIVNISSVAGMRALPSSFAYCSSKAGLDHFTRCIALELASSGVRVNGVNPGPVKTDIVENIGVPTEAQGLVWEHMKKATALNRIAEPEEIADLVAFLASYKARSMTGSSILTDNGMFFNGLQQK